MAGVLNQIDFDPSFYLSPLAAVIVRDTDAAAKAEPAADPDIYTLYDSSHPWSLDLGLYAGERPDVDVLLRYGVLTRFLPHLNAHQYLAAKMHQYFHV